jgi:hypothetical protein
MLFHLKIALCKILKVFEKLKGNEKPITGKFKQTQAPLILK